MLVGRFRQKGATDRLRCEVAVIGSGPGGAVTAATCAEAGRDVLVLEEGPGLTLDSAPHFSREEILQKYRNAGVNVAFGDAKVAYVEGRCVGGGSEINRGLYHRTPGHVLEEWSERFHVAALDPGEMEEHFAACEDGARVEHLPPGAAPALSCRLKDGADRLGWECIEVPRLCTYSELPGGGVSQRKQSMSETFIPRALSAGATVLADARVCRLSRGAHRWLLSVERSDGGIRQALEIEADTVFVACGAVQTPALLRRSGITRNVGDTLRFHPMLKVVALFPDEVNQPDELEPVHQVKEFDPRFSMGCSMSKRPALAMAIAAAQPERLHEVDSDWRRMAIYYAQTTRGNATVRVLPGFRDPLVRAHQAPGDLAELAEAVRRLCECLFAAGAEAVYPGIPGFPALRCDGDLERLPADIMPSRSNLTALHLFSSCPMGENRDICAADSFGRVSGTEGLRIADASLLCGPTVVNPQGTVMAVARRNALHFLEQRSRPESVALKLQREAAI